MKKVKLKGWYTNKCICGKVFIGKYPTKICDMCLLEVIYG